MYITAGECGLGSSLCLRFARIADAETPLPAESRATPKPTSDSKSQAASWPAVKANSLVSRAAGSSPADISATKREVTANLGAIAAKNGLKSGSVSAARFSENKTPCSARRLMCSTPYLRRTCSKNIASRDALSACELAAAGGPSAAEAVLLEGVAWQC